MDGTVILRIIERGLSAADYERLRDRLDIDRNHPLGMIMHGASEVDGLIHVAQVWEGASYARSFDEEVLRPALEALGLPLQADIKVFKLNHLVTP
jgi:hypothetical protein